MISLLFATDLQGATIGGFAAGFANQTPGFWGIEFQAGAPAERITSVVLKMPGPGFFDFDGVDNYQNQTAPIFDAGSSLGLSADQVFFSFAGEHPKVLRIRFAPDAFAPGDRLQFAADIDGLGSKVGGALGGYGGVQMTIALSDRRTGVANFRTDTEVASRVTVDIAPSTVPETGNTFWLLLCGGLILCALDALRQINGLKPRPHGGVAKLEAVNMQVQRARCAGDVPEPRQAGMLALLLMAVATLYIGSNVTFAQMSERASERQIQIANEIVRK